MSSPAGLVAMKTQLAAVPRVDPAGVAASTMEDGAPGAGLYVQLPPSPKAESSGPETEEETLIPSAATSVQGPPGALDATDSAEAMFWE